MNKTAAPKLRFPEFQDEWEEKTINEIFDVNEKPEKATTFDNQKIITVKLHALGVVKNERNSTLTGGTNYFKRRAGEFIFSKIDLLNGAFGLVPNALDGFYSSTDVPAFRFKNKNSSFFFLNWLKANYLKLNIERTGTSSTLKRVSPEKFLETLIYLPSLPEQQKIADCLTSLDDLIAAQSQKVETLQAYKKGLLQNLFPAEGESVPRLRFGEFQSAGGWETAVLSEVYSFKVTNSFSRDQLNYENGSVKNIHYGDIHMKFSTLFDITKETVPYINPSQSIEAIKMDSYCVEGDMIFADASEDLNDVGKSIEIVNLNNEKVVSGMHTLLARQITPRLAIGFGGYLFKSDRIRTQIKKEAQGAKVLGISSGRLSSIEICFPSDKREQQRIAELLSALDEEIHAQGEAVAALKVHKKGLLQGLFP